MCYEVDSKNTRIYVACEYMAKAVEYITKISNFYNFNLCENIKLKQSTYLINEAMHNGM